MMKSASEMICFQEVPDEVSLSFSISNCPNNCPECHSPWLREDCGREVFWLLPQLLRKYKDKITCVLFMGGNDEKQRYQLLNVLHYCQAKGFKTALYSGFNEWPDAELLDLLDYVKIGSYNPNYGGLKHSTTNQRMYKKQNGVWEDITARFWSSDII
jgi:anaerobic ribonucleoside-triphosphate reductase activating protein